MSFTRFKRAVGAFVLVAALAASAVRAELIHRYTFDDGAKDSVGKVDGTLKGNAKVTDGKLVLDNGAKTSDDPKLSYVEFPAPIIPKSGSVSLVVWITGKDHPLFARVLDIGDSDGGEGRAFIYLVPQHEEQQSRAAITATDTGGRTHVVGARLDDGKPHMAAVVVDGAAKQLHLYVDGKETAKPEDLGDNTLDKVKPIHNWIGRSGFDADPGLTATIEELRVYDHALMADDVAAMEKAGAKTVPATKP
jgi:hypothetical protein